MRIEFIHAEQPSRSWSSGSLRIGSAADNDLRLREPGVAAHHVVLSRDARGMVLEVCAGAGRVYVNARPVREKALLRHGDSLGIGSCRMRLVADAVARGSAPARVVIGCVVRALRAVAGTASGQVHALEGKLALNARGAVTTHHEGALIFEPHGRQVRLDASGMDPNMTVQVNGCPLRQALLADGDQVVLGSHHFVVDISAEEASSPAPATLRDDSEADAGAARADNPTSHPEVWWLISTAAVLALALAGALLIH